MRADPLPARRPPPGSGSPPRRRAEFPPLRLLPLLCAVLVIPILSPTPTVAQAALESAREVEERCGVQVVPGDEIEAAVRARRGYDVTAAPNEGRFLAELLLDLAADYRERRPDGPPLLIRQQEFFPAFLRATGLSAGDAPPNFRKAKRFGQRIVVEYRGNRVVERVKEGPTPRQAVAVRAAWPDSGSLPSAYTYEDTASEPDVRVREEHDIHYRLLEFVAVVAYDEMEGVSGRPISGPLGALFDVIGMARIRESRFAVAGDAQVTFTRVRKVVSHDAVATVTADGRARQGIPEDRPGLERLRELVTRDFEIEYTGAPPALCPATASPG